MSGPLVAVAGTGTEVGKTWFALRLLAAARDRGLRPEVVKPAQSFEPGDEGSTDADLLGRAAGVDPRRVCPSHRWYPVPMAPVMAAEVLGRAPFTIAELAAEVGAAWSGGGRLRVVETAGGLRSPLAVDGDCLDLVAALAPDLVVVVADAGLGTLHQCRSAAASLDDFETLFVVNRFDQADDLHRRNREWLIARDGLSVLDPAAAVRAILDPHIGGGLPDRPAGPIRLGSQDR